MTPSEIADWLDSVDRAYNAAGSSTSAHPTDKFAQAAATIREIEAKLNIAMEALVQSDLTIRSLPNTDQRDVEFIRQALARIKEWSDDR